MKLLILLAIGCFVSSCANPHAYKSPQPKAEFLTMVDRKFTSPNDGTIFHLTLGKQLDLNDRGVTDDHRKSKCHCFLLLNQGQAGVGS